MKTLKTASLTAALCLTAAAAFAGSADAPLSKTVDYSALNVTTTAGAEHLYQRLQAAAQRVCEPANGTTLSQKYHFRVCVDTALSDAIARVDQPLVTTIYNNRSIRLASL